MRKNSRYENILDSRFFLQIISVGLAMLLWFYVAGDRTSETVKSFRLPLEYQGLGPGLSLNNPSSFVDVQVTGKVAPLRGLTQENLSCFVAIRDLGPGKYTLPVTPVLPSGISLVTVSPSSVRVEISRNVEKTMPITLRVQGDFPEGYALVAASLDPPEVLLKGPDTSLGRISEVWAAPRAQDLVDDGDGVMSLPLSAQFSGLRDDRVWMEPKDVRLRFELSRELPQKQVPLRAHVFGDVDPNYTLAMVTVRPLTVSVWGPSSVLAGVSFLDIESVDVSGLRGNATFSANILSPGEGLTVYPFPTVQVQATVRPVLISRTFSSVPVDVEGRSIYPRWKVDPNKVKVTLRGLVGVLSGDGAPRAYVEVTNLVSRRVTVPVRLRGRSADVEVVEISPPMVTVYALVE